jgi:phytoene dehydrogenase-like protein
LNARHSSTKHKAPSTKTKHDYDAIIIGAGHNGLVTACYLAKAGLKTLVLERREIVGGGAITEEFHPGFRCSILDHAPGPFSSQVAADLSLASKDCNL